jgi:site-specific DNA recombinase
VDEEKMAIVRRIFRMVAVEGTSTHRVARTLELEGIPNPGGGRYWYKRLIKRFILDDVYKPHSFEETAAMMSPEVAARLDPERSYGIWWFNRRRTTTTQIAVDGPEGREYKKKNRIAYKDKREWIAVPVVDSGVPREWVNAARTIVAGYRSPSKLSGRYWELSGAIMRCGECGRAMEPVDRYYRTRSGKKGVICYYRCREGNRRKETCSNNRSIRSDKAHPAVWDLISDLLSDPERLRTGLEAMIEEQRQALRGNPEHEIKVWLEKLAALDRKRSGYLDLAAEGILEREELRAKLAELQEARETVEKELRVIEGRKDHVQQLEHDRDALMEHYAGLVPESLNDLSPEERHQIYKMLRLKVLAYPDKSLEVSGSLVDGGEAGEMALNGAPPDRGLGASGLTQTS